MSDLGAIKGTAHSSWAASDTNPSVGQSRPAGRAVNPLLPLTAHTSIPAELLLPLGLDAPTQGRLEIARSQS